MNKARKILNTLMNRRFLKVIAGINNFDSNKVLKILNSSRFCGVDCVDISANPEIIQLAVDKASQTAICVSSVDPEELLQAQRLGADMLELGNYEALHDLGLFPAAKDILSWTKSVLEFKDSALLSVTIPGHLPVEEQIDLALQLEALGVEILQTEGASLMESHLPSALGQIQKASLTLANTIELARNIKNSYLMTASGLNPELCPLAIAAGAHGIGVGRYINKLETELEMIAAIKSIQEALVPKLSRRERSLA